MIIYSKVTDEPDEAVSLTEVKAELKIDSDVDDTYLTGLIATATKLCEADAGLSFVEQERTVKLDRFPSGCIILPYGPVQSVDSFEYLDSNGDSQTLTETTDFIVDNSSDVCRVHAVDTWPDTLTQINAVTIVYTAGEATANATAKTAVIRTVTNLYEHRTNKVEGSYSPVDYTVRTILDRIRVTWNAWQD